MRFVTEVIHSGLVRAQAVVERAPPLVHELLNLVLWPVARVLRDDNAPQQQLAIQDHTVKHALDLLPRHPTGLNKKRRERVGGLPGAVSASLDGLQVHVPLSPIRGRR